MQRAPRRFVATSLTLDDVRDARIHSRDVTDTMHVMGILRHNWQKGDATVIHVMLQSRQIGWGVTSQLNVTGIPSHDWPEGDISAIHLMVIPHHDWLKGGDVTITRHGMLCCDWQGTAAGVSVLLYPP